MGMRNHNLSMFQGETSQSSSLEQFIVPDQDRIGMVPDRGD